MSFKDKLLTALKDLFTSKKAITALVGIIVLYAAKRGIVLEPEMVNGIIAIVSSLLLAQGAQDLGKAKALIQAANPPPPETIAAGGDVTIGTEGRR